MTVRQQTESAAAKGFKSWVVRHPVVAFVALASWLSWLAWLPGLLGFGGTVSLLIGGLGQLVAALLVTRCISASVRAWWRPVWRCASLVGQLRINRTMSDGYGTSATAREAVTGLRPS